MCDYTPTTEQVFQATLYTWLDWKQRYATEDEARAGFDRWLAEHDREKDDRIKELEGERDALDKQVWRMRALRTDDSAERTLASAEARADRAEARLARVTDGTRWAEALYYLTDGADWDSVTEGERAELVEAAVAMIRAVAADEQEADHA